MYPNGSFLVYLIFLNLKMGVCYLSPREISDVEVSFVKDNTEFLINNIRVSWNEALTLCETNKNGTLAILDTNITIEFFAEALSVTDLKLENLWIGARKKFTEQNFTWIDSGKSVSDTNFLKRAINAPIVARNCVSLGLKYIDTPHFIDMQCELRRPFICQRVFDKLSSECPMTNTERDSMTNTEWFLVGEYFFAIFNDKKSWKESVRECRTKHGAHLASFRNLMEIEMVGKHELIGRPSLQSVWIGGYFTNGFWKFIFDGSIIPNSVDPKTLFPPWKFNTSARHSGCLLLNRNFGDKNSTFLEGHCKRKRSYICSKKVDPIPDPSIIVINNTGYIISFSKKNWADAREECVNLNAKLVKVTPENVYDITFIMAESVIEVAHIWIGGRLSKDGTYFYWVSDKEKLPIHKNSSNNFPPWYASEYFRGFDCLNMDQEIFNIPVFYGIHCATPQAFICQQDDITKLPIDVNQKKFMKN